MDLKMKIRQFLIFIIPRYPLFQILSLLMFLGERAKITDVPPFSLPVIYAFIVLLFLTTVGMGLRQLRSQSALFACILLTSLCYIYYANESLNYHPWLKVRICQGIFGAVWTLLLYAYFSYQKPRPRWLQRVAEYLATTILIMDFFLFWYSGQDEAAFHHLISPSSITFYAYISLIICIALAHYNQMFTYELTFVMGVLWTCKVAFISMNLDYWCLRKRVDYWTQMRLVGDSVAFIIGSIFYITSFIKPPQQHSKAA